VKVALIGSTGQLGQDLAKAFQPTHEVIGLTHAEIEVTDRNSFQFLRERKPDVIIDTAAFHKTDVCEDEPLKAFSINAVGPKNVAEFSKEIGATSVFISSDYVFSGNKKQPYTEDDVPDPINTYGISKLAGELFTRMNPKHYVFRVASLFGAAGSSGKGGNFVETMLGKAKRNEAITVVGDMWMSPTYTNDAALTMKEILKRQLPFGTYHLTNSGQCTWFEFTQEIFRQTGLSPNLKQILTSQNPTKAARPLYSVLKSAKLPKYGLEARDWQLALHDYLVEKGHIPK
jgi:dTDP-4-dehydrorhamnose reductase